MIKTFYVLVVLFFISFFGYGQIHYEPQKFSIGLTGTHYNIDKAEQISFLYLDAVNSVIGRPFVDLYGVGVKAQFQVKKWLSVGAEFSRNQAEVENYLSTKFVQKITVNDFGGFAKIYPISILDSKKRRKFMPYIPLRIFYSIQNTVLDYEVRVIKTDKTYNTIDVSRKINYKGLSYSIRGVGVDFYAGKNFIINAEYSDDFEFADTRRYSIGILYRF